MSTIYRLSVAAALLAVGLATTHADARSEIRQWQIRKGLVQNNSVSRSSSFGRSMAPRGFATPYRGSAIVGAPTRTLYTPAYQGGGHEGHGAPSTTASGTSGSCGGASSHSGCCH